MFIPASLSHTSAAFKPQPAGPSLQGPRRLSSAQRPVKELLPQITSGEAVQTSKLPRKNPKSAREAAVLQLERISSQGTYIHIGKRADVTEAGKPPVNGRLEVDARAQKSATGLVAGVLKSQRRLDHLLSPFLAKPEGLAPGLLNLLRLGAYELLVASSMVTQLQEAQVWQQPLQLDAAASLSDQLGLYYSHPSWMVQRWLQQFGQVETIDLLCANNRLPEYGIRVSPGVEGGPQGLLEDLQVRLPAEVEVSASEYLPDYFLHTVRGLQDMISMPQFKAGQMQVMSESAGMVVRLLDPQPGERILDACAAPGSKTLFAASLMQGKGQIVALDSKAARLKLLESAARKQGLSSMIHPVACQLQDLQQQHPELIPLGGFDTVLVDAPCSGTGTLAKRADLRWQRLPDDLSDLCTLQATLLDAAAALVRMRGFLVYSTCSIEDDEDEAQILSFLQRHTNFKAVPSQATCLPQSVISSDGFLRIFQHRHGIEGAFAAVLQREQ
ncbi:hypothetical protein WJX74_005497 [Apatococcus lobatus]|uniref:SAM-dependent MTase RsmB/NOP-type domain-containing protein n=1 Tax=Apatococcus lobatus TaxID=904363 RepID=A0AAW1REY9_9CHLO